MNTRLGSIITLLIIITITLFTRFWQINNYPPALFSDEVDAGYQATVFNAKGTDYFGRSMPTHFHSFSDWRTPAYIYSIALSQKITHNPELSVRLPSAIFSCLSVIIFYLITNSFLAAFFLAISPWAIHFGRTGFEVSGMLLVILLGIYFWQKYLQRQKIYLLFLSALFFCLSPYFYSTAKLFLPLIFLVIFIVWFKPVLKIKPVHLFLVFFSATIFLTPLIIDTYQGHSGFRFNYISIFTEPHREQITDQLRYEDIFSSNIGKIGVPTPKTSFLLHNKYELILERFIQNYLSSFSTEFLFLHGDLNLRQGFGGHGMLYIADFFLIIAGLVTYFKKPSSLGKFFLLLLILSPIPFSLTRDSISAHSTRLILMLPSLLYFASLNFNKRYFIYPFYLVLFFIFWHYYTHHYPQISAPYWHTNMKEAVLASNPTAPSPIYYSDKTEPFLPFFLFYTSYLSPDNHPVANHISHLNNNYFDGSVIDNHYYFGHLNWNKLPLNNATYVISKSEYLTLNNLNDFKIIKTISKKYLGSDEFYILKSNEN